MRLSDCPTNLKLDIVRDGDFRAFGFVTHDWVPERLVFVSDREYLDGLMKFSGICCVLTTASLAREVPEELGLAISEHPRRHFYSWHTHLAHNTDFYGSDVPSEISASARIHPTAYVADRNVRIGERVLVEPNVTVLEHVSIEDDVILRAGCIVGTEGFQFEVDSGRPIAVPHTGRTRLCERVEIQSGTCVDRAVFGGETVVGADSKIDKMVHVGHNAVIGKRCRIAAMAMIGGSVFIGDDVWVGPNATISDNIRIGDRAFVTLGAVATIDVAADQKVSGNFAIDHIKYLEFLRSIR